jgi:hypothetical protein
MSITVRHRHFQEISEAETEVAEAGLHCIHQVMEASAGMPLHWHAVDVHGYVIAGCYRFSDPITHETHECVRGSYFHIPGRTLHSEPAHNGCEVILGLPEAFDGIPEPMLRHPSELAERPQR